jgi:hypothetical protein
MLLLYPILTHKSIKIFQFVTFFSIPKKLQPLIEGTLRGIKMAEPEMIGNAEIHFLGHFLNVIIIFLIIVGFRVVNYFVSSF